MYNILENNTELNNLVEQLQELKNKIEYEKSTKIQLDLKGIHEDQLDTEILKRNELYEQTWEERNQVDQELKQWIEEIKHELDTTMGYWLNWQILGEKPYFTNR